uniref:Lipase maturation factor n=1 Tax=Bos taurus TaxID=9913 RepID=A0A452DHY3_BOVIN
MRHNRCPTLWPTSCTAPRGGSTASRPSATTSWSWWCPSSSSSDGGCASSTGPCRSCSSSGSAARVDSGRRCGTRTLGREEPELDPERSGQLVALDVTLKGQPCTRLPSSKALGASVQERAEDVSTRTSSHAQFAQLFRKVLRVLQRQPVVYMGRRTTSTSDPHALPRRDPAGPVVSFCCGPSRTSYPHVNQARGSWSTQSHIPDSRPYLPPRPAFSKLHDISHSPRNIAVGTSLQLWAQRAAPTSLSDLSTAGVVLIISGNLSFLNWLTIVPSLACFDDATLGGLFPSGPGRLKDQVLKIQEEETRGARAPRTRGSVARGTVNLALGILVAWLSIPVVLNLLSPRQVMNSSFNPLRIVNTYGAFGSITRERTEVILQGTASANASAPDSAWEDYEFKCKPGDPRRRPCLISPYHHRLDWLMWFAAFQTYEHNEWIIHLAGKLLANDAQALSLLARNPFEGRDPPRWVRGEHYRYKFSRPGGRHAAEGKWWIRRRLGPYFPPLSRQDLRGYFTSRQWPYPEPE